MARNLVSVFLLCSLGTASMVGVPIRAAEIQTTELACQAESEANDTPAKAQAVSSAFCVEGALAQRQHLFTWSVPDAIPGQAWSIALDGGIGQDASLRFQRLEPAPTGLPAGGDEVFGITMPEGGGSIRSDRLLFRSGAYLVTLASRTHGPYRLRIAAEVAPLAASRPNDTIDRAAPLAANAFIAGDRAGSQHFFSWKIGAADAKRRWTLEANGPLDETLSVELQRASGEVLVSRSGRLAGPIELSELGLDPGDYIVRIVQPTPNTSPYTLRLVPGGPRIASREEEPNDTMAQARGLALGQTVTGRLWPQGDIDVFVFTADDRVKGKQLELSFQSSGRTQRKICLTTAKGDELQCRRGATMKLPNLVLDPGLYGISISGQAEARQTYSLTLRLAGPQQPNFEIEPNDTMATATPLDPAQPMHGRLAGSDDVDFFRFKVEGEPRLWTVTARGRGVASLSVLDHRGGRLGSGMAGGSSDSVEATGVFLLPGEYWIELSGKEADYSLEVKSTGPPDPNAEREPNDRDNQANLLRVGVPRTGTLPDDRDRDIYRFSLAAPAHVALEVAPPENGDITVELEWGYPDAKRPTGSAAGAPLVYEAWLEPGDYLVRLRADRRPSSSPYRISLSLLDPFDLPDDLEPNDTPAQARPLPASLAVTGNVGQFGDDDWYDLPLLERSSALHLDIEGSVVPTLMDGTNPLPATWQKASGTLEAEIPAGRVIKLGIKGAGRYSLRAAFADGPKPLPAHGKLPLQIAVDLGAAPVAAYWIRGQLVHGSVVLKNTGANVLDLALDALSSNYAFRPLFGSSRLTLAPGVEERVPLEVVVAPDAWADRAVQVAVRARAADGAASSATARLSVDPAAPPQAEQIAFPLPKELLGGINVAAIAIGGSVVVPESEAASAAERALLHDGLVSTAGFAVTADKAPVTLTTRFGGDRQWPVAGITLQPQIENRLYPPEQLRDFELLLSADGTSFQPVLSGRLTLLPIEQAFVLEKPFPARAAQLRLKSNHAGNIGKIGLNEWKVIAVPGEPRGVSLNIADAARGGHIVWADPTIGVVPDDSRAILEGRRAHETKVAAGKAPQWVVGFHEDRAAQIASFQWVEEDSARADAARFSALTVETSVEGPLGPWKELGLWALQRDQKGVAKWSLPEPVWARFVRFASTGKSSKETVWVYPKSLRIDERATGGDYLSILGEWGQYNRDAIMEASRPLPAEAPAKGREDNHLTRETARGLAIGEHVASEVRLGSVEDWYAIEIPAAANLLTLTSTGEPTVDVDVGLEDGAGQAVPMRVVAASAGELALEATVKAGSAYYARVREPPRSVAIAYDTSGSLAPFSTAVYQAVLTFAGGVAQRREFVNFMNFQSPFLLEEWSDQSWALQGALLAPREESDSSDLPATMMNALAGLRARRGVRAMIVVTDAETPGYDRETELWRALSEVRPRIFTAHIGAGADPLREKQIMQDLASVNAGFYASARTQAGMDVVAERAAAWLRRPARYQLTATVRSGPPPQPGTIAVVAASAAPSGAANAAEMARALKDTGKVDIHGINFDVDKTIIKPGSAATLEQVAKLLRSQPVLKLEVAGHTDNTGGAEHNLKLSGGRAAAVVDALVKRYGIAATRLQAQGYGDTRPVATNEKEAGRALNRRVELKELSAGDSGRAAPDMAPAVGEAGQSSGRLPRNAPYAVIDRAGNQVLTGTVNGGAHEIAAGDYIVAVTAGGRKIERSATVTASAATIVQVALADEGSGIAGMGAAAGASLKEGAAGDSPSPPSSPPAASPESKPRKAPQSQENRPSDSGEKKTAAAITAAPRPRAPPGAAPEAPKASPISVLTGIPGILDTGTLVVGGQIVKLSGVVGQEGVYLNEMIAYVGRRTVTCRLASKDAYSCDMSGQSLARAVVFNGGARASADAPAELKSAERDARAGRRGIWRGQ